MSAIVIDADALAAWEASGVLRDRIPSPLAAKLWSRALIVGECWDWQRGCTAGGYGILVYQNKRYYAHRLAYEICHGPIPDGFQVDHLCRNRRCINPAHLEAVTQLENWRRGTSPTVALAAQTHCKHGHPLTPDNVYISRGNRRHCRTCSLGRSRARSARRKVEL